MADFDESQVRAAFAHVRDDIAALRILVDKAQTRQLSIESTFPLYTDKKEFYQFVEAARAELDNLESSLAAKSSIEIIQKRIASLSEKLADSDDKMAALETRLAKSIEQKASSAQIEKLRSQNSKSLDALRRRIESDEISTAKELDLANEESAKVFAEMRRQTQKVSENQKVALEQESQRRQLGDEALFAKVRDAEKNISKSSERIKDLSERLNQKSRELYYLKEKIAKKERSSNAKKSPLFAISVIALLVMILLVLSYGQFADYSYGSNGSSAQSSAAGISALNLSSQSLDCVLRFECAFESNSSVYANCNYSPSASSCECDVVQNASLCNLELLNEAKNSRWSLASIILTSFIVITLVAVAVVLIARMFVLRSKKKN